MTEKSRTKKQNDAYWAWLEALSKELLEKGVDMKEMITFEIMPSPELIHKNITHRLIKKFYGKTSTTELTTKEMSEITEVIRQGFISKTNGEVNVPFIPELTPEQYEQAIQNQKKVDSF